MIDLRGNRSYLVSKVLAHLNEYYFNYQIINISQITYSK